MKLEMHVGHPRCALAYSIQLGPCLPSRWYTYNVGGEAVKTVRVVRAVRVARVDERGQGGKGGQGGLG